MATISVFKTSQVILKRKKKKERQEIISPGPEVTIKS